MAAVGAALAAYTAAYAWNSLSPKASPELAKKEEEPKKEEETLPEPIKTLEKKTSSTIAYSPTMRRPRLQR